MIFGLYQFIQSDLDSLYIYGLENNLLRSGNAQDILAHYSNKNLKAM